MNTLSKMSQNKERRVSNLNEKINNKIKNPELQSTNWNHRINY